MFNLAQDHCINLDTLNKIISKPTTTWITFSNEEFKSTINKYNTLSTSGLDHISWKYLKSAIKNKKCLNNFINITNIYIKFGYWPAVRCSSHRGGSLQDGLRDEQTCGMILASAYVLRHLFVVWLQLQIKERKSK